MNRPEDVLLKVVEALRAEDSAALDAALQSLQEDDLREGIVRGLLACLVSNDELMHEMYGVLHTIERCAPGVLYSIVAQEFEGLASRSPFWASTVVGRLLNVSSANGDRFDAGAFIEEVRHRSGAGSWEKFREIVRQLHERRKIPASVAQEVLET